MKKFWAKLGSRKLWSFIGTTVLSPVLIAKGVPEIAVQWLIGLAGTYILGQSAVDAVSAKNGKK